MEKAYYLAHREEISQKKRAHYQANRARILAANRARRLANLEEYRARDRAYGASHRSQKISYNHAYYARRREELCEQVRLYAQRVDGKTRISAYKKSAAYRLAHAARQATRRGGLGRYTPQDVRACLDAQDGRCFYCLASLLTGFHVDHMTPLCRGGTNTADNIVCACVRCNLRKSRKTAAEFILGRVL